GTFAGTDGGRSARISLFVVAAEPALTLDGGVQGPREQEREVRYANRGTFSIAQIVEAASEVKFFSQSGWLDVATESICSERAGLAVKRAARDRWTRRRPHPRRTWHRRRVWRRSQRTEGQ